MEDALSVFLEQDDETQRSTYCDRCTGVVYLAVAYRGGITILLGADLLTNAELSQALVNALQGGKMFEEQKILLATALSP